MKQLHINCMQVTYYIHLATHTYLATVSPCMCAVPLSYIVMEIAFIAGAIWPNQFAKTFPFLILELSNVAETRGPLKAPSPPSEVVSSHVTVIGDASLVLDGSEEGLQAASAAAARRRGRRSWLYGLGRNGPRPLSGPEEHFWPAQAVQGATSTASFPHLEL